MTTLGMIAAGMFIAFLILLMVLDFMDMCDEDLDHELEDFSLFNPRK